MEDLDYLDALTEFPSDFDAKEVFKELTDDPEAKFDPRKSKANLIVNPAVRYIHRIIAYSFSRRKDNATVISETELYFLWAMIHSKKVNLGYWLIVQIDSVQSKKRGLILGQVITTLAVNLGLISLEKPKP